MFTSRKLVSPCLEPYSANTYAILCIIFIVIHKTKYYFPLSNDYIYLPIFLNCILIE